MSARPKCFGVLYPYGQNPDSYTYGEEISLCSVCVYKKKCSEKKAKEGPMGMPHLREWLEENVPSLKWTDGPPPVQQARIILVREVGLEKASTEEVSASKCARMALGAITDKDKADIRRLYQEEKQDTATLCQKYGLSAQQMRYLLKSLGCKLRRGRKACIA